MTVLPFPKSRIATWAILTILLSAFAVTTALAADPVMDDPDPNDMRLLRSPDIHGDNIVFTYGYVVDDNKKLLGVIVMRDLLLSSADDLLSNRSYNTI